MGTKLSQLSAVTTPLGGTEILVCVQTTTKRLTLDQIAAYSIDELLGASAQSPLTGDNIVAERSGAEGLMDLDELAAYAVASAWSEASEADPAVTGDKILADRSGTVYWLDVDTIQSYVLDGVQASSLDVSGLDSATLNDADEYLVCQSGTAKKQSFANIAARVHDQIATYVGALDAGAAVADAHSFYCLQSGTAKEVTASQLATYMLAEIAADVVATSWDADAVDPLLGTDVLILERSDVAKTATAAVVAAYAVGTLDDADAVDPAAAGDDIILFRSGTEKKCDIDVLSTYIVAQEISVASGTPLTTFAASDEILMQRSGVLKTMDYTDVQLEVLDPSALDEATLADDDVYIMAQSGVAKRQTFANVAARVHDQIDTYLAGLDAVVTVGATDKFYTTQSGTAKYVTPVEIAAYVATTIETDMTGAVFDGDSVDPVLGTDLVAVERSGTLKSSTAAVLGAYVNSLLDDASAADPALSGDEFVMYRSGTQYKVDIDDMATYICDAAAAVVGAALVDPVVGTDAVLLERGDAMEATDVDTLITYIFTQDAETTTLQTSVLTIDALGAATLADANYLLIDDGGPKQKTLGAVAAYVHAGFAEYVSDQADADPVVDGDHFLVSRSDAALYIAASDLATYMLTEHFDQTTDTDPEDADVFIIYRSGTGYRKVALSDLQDYMTEAIEDAAADLLATGWNVVDSGNYTATPASTTRITMSDTTGMAVGIPLRYTYGGVAYYGIVEEVVTNSYIDVRGITLNVGSPLTELAYGLPSRAHTIRLKIPGNYLTPWYIPEYDADFDGVGDSEQDKDILSEIGRQYFTWRLADAYMVAAAVTQGTADGTVQPKIGVEIDSTDVLSQDSNKGIQVSGTPGTWTWNDQVSIATGGYKIETGEALEIVCTANGSSGEAADLSIELVFVFE